LCELLSPEFKPADIRVFLHAWTSGPRYLKAVARGELRRYLDGSPAGLPEPEHRAAAKERVAAIGHSGGRSHAQSGGSIPGAKLRIGEGGLVSPKLIA
jgi:sRNA-binding protein